MVCIFYVGTSGILLTPFYVFAGSEVQTELYYQSKFLTVLQSICTSLFVVRTTLLSFAIYWITIRIQATISLVSFDWERSRSNFFRRYKWAFKEETERPFQLPVVAQPELHQFIKDCGEILIHRHHNTNGNASHEADTIAPEAEATAFSSPAECIGLAKVIAKAMIVQNESGSWAGVWAKDRVNVSCCLRHQPRYILDRNSLSSLSWYRISSPFARTFLVCREHRKKCKYSTQSRSWNGILIFIPGFRRCCPRAIHNPPLKVVTVCP